MIASGAADTARLARACHLDVERVTSGTWVVSGGARPHLVAADASSCDCTDFGVRGGPCKHILAVRLQAGDAETLRALRALVAAPRPARRRADDQRGR